MSSEVKKATKKKDTRSRLWATIVYPESAPENWQQILRDSLNPCFISPLHDRDVTADGAPKKPHYHVLWEFKSNKSQEQIKALSDAIGGVGQERLDNKSGSERYICHLDHPDKAQYSPEDVISLGGLDYIFAIGAVSNKYAVIREIIGFINDNDVFYYNDLLDYAAQYKDSWFRVLCDNGSYVVKEYIQSRAYKAKMKMQEEAMHGKSVNI